MNQLSPKQRFLTSPHAAEHQKWSRSEISKAAIEAALAIMASELKGESLSKLEGASHFANVLLNLSEPDEKRRPVGSATLKYEQPQS